MLFLSHINGLASVHHSRTILTYKGIREGIGLWNLSLEVLHAPFSFHPFLFTPHKLSFECRIVLGTAHIRVNAEVRADV